MFSCFVLARKEQKQPSAHFGRVLGAAGGGTAGLLPEDAGDDCVWPPSGDAKEFVWGGGLDLPREYITGVSSTSEL